MDTDHRTTIVIDWRHAYVMCVCGAELHPEVPEDATLANYTWEALAEVAREHRSEPIPHRYAARCGYCGNSLTEHERRPLTGAIVCPVKERLIG